MKPMTEQSALQQAVLKGATAFRVQLSETQVTHMLRFLEMMQDWNERMNLTGITQPREMVTKHAVDSLALGTVLEASELTGKTLHDVGTGAGLPGLPLAIAFPELHVTLSDALQKRITFLQAVVTELGLTNVTCIHARAEELGQETKHREQYDYVVARAVAHLSVLSEYCLPLVSIGGQLIAYKQVGDDEIQQATNAISILGGSETAQHTLTLPGTNIERQLVTIHKTSPTPTEYPRRAGKPTKHPL